MTTSDTLSFYAFSADRPAGFGIGDVVADPSLYSALNAIPNWRRCFSSLYSEEPFIWNGHTYRSVEHALQSAKFTSAGYHEDAFVFSFDSGDPLGQADGKEARKNRKRQILSSVQMTQWHAQERETKWSIYSARYSAGRAREALLGTRDAILINRGPRIQTIRCTTLEAMRETLQKSQN